MNNNLSYIITPYGFDSLTYVGNGSDGGYTRDTAVRQGNIVPIFDNGFDRTGYLFRNWNTESDGSGYSHSVGSIIRIQGNDTLYSQWQDTATISAVDRVPLRLYHPKSSILNRIRFE